MNRQLLAADRPCRAAIPSAAGRARAAPKMDGRRSFVNLTCRRRGTSCVDGFGGGWLRRGFGLFDEVQCRILQVAQLRLAWWIAREFDEVATLQEFAAALFL